MNLDMKRVTSSEGRHSLKAGPQLVCGSVFCRASCGLWGLGCLLTSTVPYRSCLGVAGLAKYEAGGKIIQKLISGNFQGRHASRDCYPMSAQGTFLRMLRKGTFVFFRVVDSQL